MTMSDEPASQREWLTSQLLAAARHVNGTVTGQQVFGWHDRTLGARIDTTDGPRWLRVTSEHHRWAGADSWTGTSDATGAAFACVPKPALIEVREWPVGEHRVRAELMDYVSDPAIAEDMVLRRPVDLSHEWWTALAQGLAAVTRVRDTKRVIIGDDVLRHRLLAAFGVDIDTGRLDWSCAHGDLHWGNLTAPTPWMLDWEHWGWAPSGYDAAVLYCASLLQPDTAEQVHERFADRLDTYSGRIAQLAAITKLLCRVEDGDHLDLARPLHQHAATVLRHL
ncbi:aminoglycoside phosphotransferase [Amycolatopsis thailandensis]|uniref:Aminoglycoside phosphotransferase n=1 Tax=Amycolatopsis thailandensis TaxID=589330 RepID=A0A229RU92_9PSEU|nr:hypothetical protein [Amycolatopsis thailandensis]OXM50257.1 aminoglycoside phosphotransferase [Amycolatopsis thailandensis]